MDQALVEIISNVSFGALFVYLFWYTLKRNEARESKYQEIIDENQKIISNLSDKLDVVEDIKEDLNEIKEIVTK